MEQKLKISHLELIKTPKHNITDWQKEASNCIKTCDGFLSYKVKLGLSLTDWIILKMPLIKKKLKFLNNISLIW